MLKLVKSGKITAMPRPPSQSAYNAAFRRRVRAARELSGMHPEELAKALGISKDQYLRYESRYMMRHDLIPRFCHLTGITLESLLAHPAKPEGKRQVG